MESADKRASPSTKESRGGRRFSGPRDVQEPCYTAGINWQKYGLGNLDANSAEEFFSFLLIMVTYNVFTQMFTFEFGPIWIYLDRVRGKT